MRNPTRKPRLGEHARSFSLPDESGKVHDLESYQGRKNVVLMFYPGDDTPGCIMQLCAVRDEWEGFVKRNAIVLGINHADAESHRRFRDMYNLKNPLLVDQGFRVAKLYAAVGTISGHDAIQRTVVILDTKGVVHYYQRGMPSNQELFQVLDWVNKDSKERQ